MKDIEEIFRRHLRLYVIKSMEKIQDKAQKEHRYKIRSGALEKAVNQELSHDGLVGTVFLNENIAKYGPFVHEGYAAHEIRPKNRAWLRWNVGGKHFAFARKVMHPGWKKDSFLYEAYIGLEPEMNRIFEEQTELAIEESAKCI